MAYSVEQVQRGVARYIDSEFTNKLIGWQRWVFGAGSAMFIDNMAGTLNSMRENAVIKTLNVFDDGGNVDVEKLYRYAKAEANKTPISFKAPMLGTVSMSEADIDKIYTCIIQS